MNEPINTYGKFDLVDLELSSLDRRQTITSNYASRLGFLVFILSVSNLLFIGTCLNLSSTLAQLKEQIASREAQQKLALKGLLDRLSTPSKDIDNKEDQ